ncbi:hypothetical protein D3C79_1083570 [compost metagenome]
MAVICTAGCPELAPPAAAKITFGDRMPQAAYELMLKLIGNPMDGPLSKYIEIDAINH